MATIAGTATVKTNLGNSEGVHTVNMEITDANIKVEGEMTLRSSHPDVVGLTPNETAAFTISPNQLGGSGVLGRAEKED